MGDATMDERQDTNFERQDWWKTRDERWETGEGRESPTYCILGGSPTTRNFIKVSDTPRHFFAFASLTRESDGNENAGAHLCQGGALSSQFSQTLFYVTPPDIFLSCKMSFRIRTIFFIFYCFQLCASELFQVIKL